MERVKREIKELSFTEKIELNDEKIKEIIDYIKKKKCA